ncbi:MAG: alpha/beta fold hydrolase [Acidobacteriota bacterium]
MLQNQPAESPGTTGRIDVPGGTLAFDVAGTGPPVVFLHGAFLDRRSWDRQWAALSARFRTIRYDIRPFGESSRPEQPYRTHEDLLRVLDHLQVGRAHLVGHSFGGGVAIDFALVHPDRVASLLLVASAPTGFVSPEEERKAAGAVFAAIKDGDDAIVSAWLAHPMWRAAQSRPELMKELDAITRRNLAPFKMTFAPYVPLTPPAVGRLAEITARTLVVVGERDTPGIRQASELLVARIPGATLRVVSGADHALPLGWADELNAAAVAFISGEATPRPGAKKPGR